MSRAIVTHPRLVTATQADTPADSDITHLMLSAGLHALRAFDLKNPDYQNRVYTVRAIYEDSAASLRNDTVTNGGK